MTIALSIEKTLEVVYAFSAMEARKSPGSQIIGTDDAPALRIIARKVLAEIIAATGGIIIDPDFESDPDIITMYADVDSDSEVAPVISSLIASALCSGILAQISSHLPDKAAYYTSIHNSELTLIRSRLGRHARLHG